MKVTKLTVKDWGPHEKKEYELHGGLIGIVGKNGAGKSNLLQAINYALTGDLNKQKQSRYIRNCGDHEGAKSASVSLEFTCHGEPVKISRTITETGSRRELVKGDTVIKKAAELDAALQTMFGVDIESLKQAVFLQQGELAKLVKGLPSTRFAIFQKLVNLNFLEKRATDLPSVISAIQGDVEDLTPAIESMKQSLEDVKKELVDENMVNIRYDKAQELNTAFYTAKQLRYNLEKSGKTAESLREQERNIQARILEIQDGVEKMCASFAVSNADELKQLAEAKNSAYERMTAQKQAYEARCSKLERLAEVNAELQRVKASMEEKKALYGDDEAIAARETIVMKCLTWFRDLHVAEQEQASMEEEAKNTSEFYKKCLNDLAKLEELCKAEKQERERVSEELQKVKLVVKSAEYVIEAYEKGDPCPCCGSQLTKVAYDKVLRDRAHNVDKLARLQEDMDRLDNSTAVSDSAKALNTASLTKQRLDTIQARKQEAENTVTKLTLSIIASGAESTNEEQEEKLNQELKELKAGKSAYTAIMLKYEFLKKEAETLTKETDGDIPEKVDDVIYKAAKDELLRLHACYSTVCSEQNVAEKFIDDKNDVTKRLDAATNEINKLTEQSADYESRFITMCLKADEANHFSIPAPVEFKNDEEIVAFLKDNLDAATENKNRISAALQQKQMCEEHLAAMQARQNISDKHLACAKKLGRVKEVIWKRGVLLAYMTDVFNKITSVVQDLLPQLGANFSVRPDPCNPCSYLFTRTDQTSSVELPQDMLSGGQAIRLSLAMLLACQRVILPDVGLLVIDEPTSHIDADGVVSMRNMFLKMNELLCNSEMTVILVDHNTELMESIPNIIRL